MKRRLFTATILFFFLALNSCSSAADYVLSGETIDGVRVIKVVASKYKFDPDSIVVAKGEKIRLIVTSVDVDHGLAVSEFKVNIKVGSGVSESVEFVADKAGTFSAYCSVYCGSGHSKMQGKLIVLEPIH